MTDVPEPLTPTGCDLRDYTWMPLDVRRLLTSETWILGSAEVKVACMTLWCEAWQQVPAASLPDNDRIIAHLSASGPVWKKIRDDVLRGWVKCSDGRIYHPVVAEKARESWALKLAQKARTEAARQAKQNKRIAPTEVPPAAPQKDVTSSVTETVATSVTEPVAVSVTEAVTGSTRQEQTRTEQTSKEELPSVVARTREPATGTRLPDDWTPGDAGYSFAEEQGLDPNRVLASFNDYWRSKPGKDGRKSDWPATWRNWCRNEASRARPQRSSRRPDASLSSDWDLIDQRLGLQPAGRA